MGSSVAEEKRLNADKKAYPITEYAFNLIISYKFLLNLHQPQSSDTQSHAH